MTTPVPTAPLVQVALDVVTVEDARRLGAAALSAGADWIELGKPLIEFLGLRGVQGLCRELEGSYILVDLMVIAAPRRYIEAVRDLGARNVTVTALAPDATIAEAIAIGADCGVAVTVDLFNVADPVARAEQMLGLGADHLMVHFGVDQKAALPNGSPIEDLRGVAALGGAVVSYATYDIAESLAAVAAGADVIVQGHPLLGGPDPAADLSRFIDTTKNSARS